MNKIKNIERITERELETLTPYPASWHYEYRDSAYIFIGGLHYRMNEGDIVIAFSQYGEVVDCRLVRDQKTGRSKGFAFLAYEDQRSTVLAVDNLNGIELCGRKILVDHVRQYKIPREYLEPTKEGEQDDDDDNPEYEGMDEEEILKLKWEKRLYKPTGPDGKGWGDYRQLNEKDIEVMQDLQRQEDKERRRQEKLDALKELNLQDISLKNNQKKDELIVDEDKRWEMQFRAQLEKEAAEEKRRQKEQMREEIENLRQLIKLKKKNKQKKDKKDKKKKDKKKKKHKRERHDSDSD